jgi:hypothetical protein
MDIVSIGSPRVTSWRSHVAVSMQPRCLPYRAIHDRKAALTSTLRSTPTSPHPRLDPKHRMLTSTADSFQEG